MKVMVLRLKAGCRVPGVPGSRSRDLVIVKVYIIRDNIRENISLYRNIVCNKINIRKVLINSKLSIYIYIYIYINY
jgi:hypothetical protein